MLVNILLFTSQSPPQTTALIIVYSTNKHLFKSVYIFIKKFITNIIFFDESKKLFQLFKQQMIYTCMCIDFLPDIFNYLNKMKLLDVLR